MGRSQEVEKGGGPLLKVRLENGRDDAKRDLCSWALLRLAKLVQLV